MSNCKVCYQPTDSAGEAAVEVADLGYFAPAAYGADVAPLLQAACSEWKIRMYHAEGIDQDHDSGIYDIDRETKDIALNPENCILLDGKVVGFIDDSKERYYIFDGVVKWFYDYGHGDVVDRSTYLLMKK